MKHVCISDDIHIEILLRLPVKSLLRFRSVCKQWLSLISSRRFCLLHTLRRSTAGVGASSATVLLRRWGFDYYHLSVSKATLLTLPGYVIQSCNGLMLVRCYENAPADYNVYNLATGQRRALDYVPNEDENLTLVFNPSVSPYYKLICVKPADFRDSPFCYQIVVFNSESSSWSVVISSFTAPMDAHFQRGYSNCGVYWNNAVHWNGIFGGLVYFDIDKGIIGLAPDVPRIRMARSSCFFTNFLTESGGHLHFIIIGESKLSVFEMERDYSQWSFKYHIEYGGRIPFTFNGDKVIGIMRSPNEEESFVLFNISGKLIVYNLTNESFQELTELGIEEFSMERGHHDVHEFVETLAPV